jgi:ankyrin repeat protein
MESDIRNDEGLTPLLLAVSLGDKEMTQLFIDHGADINAKTFAGQTALAFCQLSAKEAPLTSGSNRKFGDTLELLQQHGAQ